MGESSIVLVILVKNLGLWFDKNMSMIIYIIKVCKVVLFYFYNIRCIWKYFISEFMYCLVRVIVIGCIDYCNSLLFKILVVYIVKL